MNYTIELPANYVKPPLPGRDKWCAALRSGQYKQGMNRLIRDGEEVRYCCLGVLSESRKEAWEVATLENQIIRRTGGDGSELYSENLY